MNVACIIDPELVNTNYRMAQPMLALAEGGLQFSFNRRGEPQFRLPHLLQADAVHVHRFVDTQMLEAVTRVRAAGIGIVWDNDDDVTAVTRAHPQYKQIGGPANSARVRGGIARMVRAVDVVTTPSPHLAAQYRDLGARDVRVLENYLPTDFERVRPVKHDGIVLVWLAGLEHNVDYQQLALRDTLLGLLERHPDLRIMSIGLGLGLPSDRYAHLPIVQFLDLARTMASADIGIAPLANIPWNHARSNIKLKEYAAAGLPWLASPVGPYLGMGEAQGGRLVADGDWGEAIDRLITDARGRRKLAKRAAKWAKGQSIGAHAHQWERALRDAITSARAAMAPGATA